MQFLVPDEHKNASGIYKITNTVNGKIYIGSTVNFYKRYHNHKNRWKSGKYKNPRLLNAVVKYGAAAFTFSVTEICSAEILTQREQFWLDELKPFTTGYNILQKAYTHLGYKHSPASIEKLRSAILDWHKTGAVNADKTTHSSRTGRNERKSVQKLSLEGELIEVFPSLNHAVKAGYNKWGIKKVCSGLWQSSKGFKWEYKSDNQTD